MNMFKYDYTYIQKYIPRRKNFTLLKTIGSIRTKDGKKQ